MNKITPAHPVTSPRKLLFLMLCLLTCTVLCQAQKVNKIIFIGDSITAHSPSIEKLGWHGNHGMAATAAEKDYVHLFVARLTNEQGSEPIVDIYARGGGRLPDQIQFLNDFSASKAQIAVVQMGENDTIKDDGETFLNEYERILEAIRTGNPDCQIFCFEVWSPPSGSARKDNLIRQACKKYGATLVGLKSVNANPRNKALSEGNFTHQGVNWHPGDRGMQAMADALWAAYKGETTTPPEKRPLQHAWTQAENWTTPSKNGWKPVPPIEREVAHITQLKPGGSALYRLELPIDKIKGGYLQIKTRVKAIDISEKPNKWNGIKLSLRLQNAEGDANYPQYHLPTGSFDWTPVQLEVTVPDNTVSAQLMIGLEQASGTVLFDEITIRHQ